MRHKVRHGPAHKHIKIRSVTRNDDSMKNFRLLVRWIMVKHKQNVANCIPWNLGTACWHQMSSIPLVSSVACSADTGGWWETYKQIRGKYLWKINYPIVLFFWNLDSKCIQFQFLIKFILLFAIVSFRNPNSAYNVRSTPHSKCTFVYFNSTPHIIITSNFVLLLF